MTTPLSLLQAQTANRNLPKPLATRLHRALSWLSCAPLDQSDDMAFITRWIALNACLGVADEQHTKLGERSVFQLFIKRVVDRDKTGLVERVLWDSYANTVVSLLENPFVMREFWQHQRTNVADWQGELSRQRLRASRYFKSRDAEKILGLVLDRLSVLRNQIMFGGATYQSSVNRSQVTEGALLLEELVPAVIGVMLDSHDDDWGEIYYPVIDDSRATRGKN